MADMVVPASTGTGAPPGAPVGPPGAAKDAAPKRGAAVQPDGSAARQPIAAATMAQAQHFYVQRCALCHGSDGRGDGVAAQNLRPKPRSFWEPGWQAAAKDEDIAMVIVRGGSAIGKSMMMPASTDLADQPQVVRALVAVVRGFQPAPDGGDAHKR